jgi:hypothetical protein
MDSGTPKIWFERFEDLSLFGNGQLVEWRAL